MKNIVDFVPKRTYGKNTVISAREAARRLNLTVVTFLNAVSSGYIKAQASPRINNKTIWGFEVEYIDQLHKVLPKQRNAGLPIFTDDVIMKLQGFNQAWEKKTS